MKHKNIGDIRDFHEALQTINNHVIKEYRMLPNHKKNIQDFIDSAIVTFQEYDIDTIAIKLSTQSTDKNSVSIQIAATSREAQQFLEHYSRWLDFSKRNEEAAWRGYAKKEQRT